MLRVTKDIMLPTTITGSLPRPSWFTENLGSRSFMFAMVDSTYREQYLDTVSVYLREQELAGLDIVTDGDAHFDNDVGGQSWTNYPTRHMSGFSNDPKPTLAGKGGLAFPPGHILHDYLEARVMSGIVGPVGRGDLQYAEMWKAAQRMTKKPVKFGTIGPELVAFAVTDKHYKSVKDRILAIADALNEELHSLADAGCPVIQFEEPQIHLLAVRNIVDDVINPQFSLEVYNRTVKGLRAKTEVWCHTCWGNPSQQRMFAQVQSYKSALELLNKVDADVITFESCSAGGMDLEAFGKEITDKKIAIGVIDHHTLQVERPEEIAEHIRRALKYIPAERLVLSSDCGMGREGMSRRHAFYKMVSLVRGTNIVRKELGLPETECLAADPRYSLVPQEKQAGLRQVTGSRRPR
jgi:5-methyltetrahydropteroyltriglutamate--homocysteine methyltransferase